MKINICITAQIAVFVKKKKKNKQRCKEKYQ